jgi:uncharacterized protein YxeA
MDKKKTTIIIISILFIVIPAVLYWINQRSLPVVTQTGAVLQTPTVEEKQSYDQLYLLLSGEGIRTNYFIITPLPKKRILEVELLGNKDKSMEEFDKWLEETGNNTIPQKNIVFK